MMRSIRYVLLSDGRSDFALKHIINWTLRDIVNDIEIEEPVLIKRDGKIEDHLEEIFTDYNPDVVFVHRDAEKMTWNARRKEIPEHLDTIPVIPVKMMEAWLLIDKSAIRKAAGNPNG